MVTVKNCGGICVISEDVAVSRSMSCRFCSAVNRPLSMDMYGMIILFRHYVEMLCPFVSERRQDVTVGMMELESALFTNTFRFIVPFIISAPHSIKSQLIETSKQQGFDRFRYETLSPIGLANPITYLCFARLHRCGMKTVCKHDSATAYRLTGIFKNDGVCFRRRKYSPDYFKTILHRSMWHPSCNGPYIRVAGILEQSVGLCFLPRSEDKSFCLNHYHFFQRLRCGKN